MINEPFAHALEWWLRSQGKWAGSVSTAEGKVEFAPNSYAGDGSFRITKWKVPGVAEPDEAQIRQILSEYKAYESGKKASDTKAASDVKSKLTSLGFSKDEIEILMKGRS